jgi:hypothetical protein
MGGECEPIKIPRGNSAYIPKSTRRLSLLTRSKPYSYSKSIGPWNRVSNRSGNMNRCWQEHVRDRRRKSDQNSVQVLLTISPNNLRSRSKNHREKAIQSRKTCHLIRRLKNMIGTSSCNNPNHSTSNLRQATQN